MRKSAATSPWYADGLKFRCIQCGNCCAGAPGYVWVNTREIQAIARQLDMSPEQFERLHTRRIRQRQSLLELDGGDCEFLVYETDGRTHCAIHSARPLQCRTWPFWESNVTNPRAWATSARHCPGINNGELYSLPIIQDALRRNADADLPL